MKIKHLFVLLVVSYCLSASSNVFAGKKDANLIVDGKKVIMDYSLTVDGKIMDSSEGKKPLEYVQGEGMIIKGLELSLLGLKKGDEKLVVVNPEDGYGQFYPGRIITVSKKAFFQNADITEGLPVKFFALGLMPLMGAVKQIDKDNVIVDFNHPLAGKQLIFKIKILDVI